MSVKLSSYVWDGCAAAGLKITAVAIMARLADFSSDEGLCWPSITTIARQLGAGESTVRTTLGKLEVDGWIKSTQRRKGNRNTSNMYQLNIEMLKAAAHASDSDTSKSDTSKSDASKFDASKNSRKAAFDPSESGGDPLVNSKQDPSEIKTLCQPAAPTDGEEFISERLTREATEVVQHLSKLTAVQFELTDGNLQHIRARLRNATATRTEMLIVVDHLVACWLGTKYARGLNPATIFSSEKFSSNLLAAKAWHASGRPACSSEAVSTDNDSTIDNAVRDAAYRRFTTGVGAGRKHSELEKLVCAEASKANVRSMGAAYSQPRWNQIWKECAQRQQEGKAL